MPGIDFRFVNTNSYNTSTANSHYLSYRTGNSSMVSPEVSQGLKQHAWKKRAKVMNK